MKVSHELPLILIEDGEQINDYDFCLPHLLDKEEVYKDYFLNARKKGRYIIMDNSLHELGEAYDIDRLLYWINEIRPHEFIVPDAWEDNVKTIQNARHWANVELPDEVTKVAVIQSNSYAETAMTTQILKDLGYWKLAFSYGASYYKKVFPHPNEHISKMLGRVKVITDLYKNGVLTNFDRVHLLGCQLPQEFVYYQEFKFIETIDTSSPIMATLDDIKYSDYGLLEKPKPNMNDHLYVEDIDWDLLSYNINKFRKINEL